VQTESGEELAFFVGGGILDGAAGTLVTVLADTAMRAKDVDEASAARPSSAPKKHEQCQERVDLARAQADLIQAAALMQFLDKARSADRCGA